MAVNRRPNLPDTHGMTIGELIEARDLLAKIGVVLIGSAIVLFVLCGYKADVLGGWTVVLSVVGWVFLLISIPAVAAVALMFKTIGRAKSSRGNFFLYDALTDTNGDINSLTVMQARERLHRLMSEYARRGKNVFLYNLFDDGIGISDSFRPLFCYDILMALSEGRGNRLCRSVLGYGKSFSETFAKYLGYADDSETADMISGFIDGFEKGNQQTVSDFSEFARLMHGKFEEKFMEYLRMHIREFD